jgi:hypothetical protein
LRQLKERLQRGQILEGSRVFLWAIMDKTTTGWDGSAKK